MEIINYQSQKELESLLVQHKDRIKLVNFGELILFSTSDEYEGYILSNGVLGSPEIPKIDIILSIDNPRLSSVVVFYKKNDIEQEPIILKYYNGFWDDSWIENRILELI